MKKLWPIFFIIFLDLMGFGIIIPTLPFVAQKFDASSFQIGLLAASYSLFQFIGSPILGRLSDKYGRKPLLVTSLLGSAVGYVMIAFASSLPLVFFSRVIDGLTGGNISVAQAYIADVTVGKERTKAMSMIGAAFGLGFIFGPLIGGFLSQYGFAWPYIFAGVLAATNSLIIFLVLPESERKETQDKAQSLFNLKVIQEVMQPRIILSLTFLFFLVTLAFSLMQGIFPLYTHEQFRWDEQANGYFFAFIGMISVITQGFILPRIIDKTEEKTLIQISLFVLTAGFAVFAFVTNAGLFYLGGMLLALSFGMLNSAIQADISRLSRPEEQGIVMGIVQSFNALGRTFGPAIGGWIYGSLFIQAPFQFATFILLIAAFYSIYIYKKHPH